MFNTFVKIKDYLRASLNEFKKITWPTKKQITNYTLVVIGLSIGVMIFFAVLDYILDLVLKAII